MLFYRDITYCSHSRLCSNTKCSRNINESMIDDAMKWWGNRPGEPIFSIADMKTDTCGYIQKETK